MGSADNIKDIVERSAFEMYDRRIIGNGYKPVKNLASIINYAKWPADYGNPDFEDVLAEMTQLRLLKFGKRGKVISLSYDGVKFARSVQIRYGILPKEKRL